MQRDGFGGEFGVLDGILTYLIESYGENADYEAILREYAGDYY